MSIIWGCTVESIASSRLLVYIRTHEILIIIKTPHWTPFEKFHFLYRLHYTKSCDSRSEFEVYRQIYKETMQLQLCLVDICDRGYLCKHYDIYPINSLAFIARRIITAVIFGTCWYLGWHKNCKWHFVQITWLPVSTSCKSLKRYVTPGFRDVICNERYHIVCVHTGSVVWNVASVVFIKNCYYGRQ